MIIHLNNTEIEIVPEGANWRVSSQRSSSAALVNDAGLAVFIQMKAAPVDPHAKYRCVRDYPWQCPYLKDGGSCPCTSKKKSDNQELASIELTHYERRQEAIGQMSLFEPTKTKRGYWFNTSTGGRIEGNGERPYIVVDTVCKPLAVASMEWLKRHMGWQPLKWRILPADDDMLWVSNQQVKHSGRYTSCVFDVWD